MTTLAAFEAVSRIEAELGAFWSTPDEQGGLPQSKVRSSTLSFAYLASLSDVELARQTTEALSDTHPGRAFVLSVDGRLAPWDVSFDVRAACRLDGGAQPICFDWVELGFGAMAAERAGSVVGALALADVPLVVELGRGAARTLASSLVPRASRVVVDSAVMTSARILELLGGTLVGVGDRQFVRTYSFRELVARFFDDAPRALRELRKIRISRTPGFSVDPAALFLGWFASRTGLSFEHKYLARDARGEAVSVEVLDEARSDVEPGQLCRIEIETSLDGTPLFLSCVRDEPGAVVWARSGARCSQHSHPLGHRDEAWVLVKALDSMESDRVYREALVVAARWSGL